MLILCVLLTVLTAGALAADTHSHCVCGGSTEVGDHTSHQDVTWTAWTSVDSLPSTAGAYYLINDVKISSTWAVDKKIQLCLNGHSITETGNTKRIIEISRYGTLILSDCKMSGKIAPASDKKVGGVRVEGNFYFYGGSIDGCHANYSNGYEQGGGVRVYGQSAVFHMYGGVIRNCTNYNDYNQGGFAGGVSVEQGTFRLYGGMIEKCTTRNDATQDSYGGYGGGVCVGDGTFDMEGGTIQNCYAYEGGGVCVNGNGTANLKGGVIRNNTACYGGGVGVFGKLNMSGGTITDCTATTRADGVNMECGDFVMTGGTIQNCNVALYVDFNANYTKTGGTMSGRVVDRTLVFFTFNTDGGSEIPTLEQKPGTAITPPEDPTKVGYTFAGWNPEIPAVMPTYGSSTKAQWTANTYTVAFDANGGQGEMAPQSMTYDVAQELSENTFTRTGYTFTGWNTQADGKGTAYEDQTRVENLTTEDGGTVTLYAQWDINQYTITFDTDGGTAVDSITQDYGTAITAPAAPIKSGYTFAGWLPELPATMPADDLELKAQWTANEGAIVFVTGGGTAIDSITGHYGDPVTRPADPEREGYTFDGWDTEIPETLNEGTLTITAKWTVNKYTITFDTDGGSKISAITQDYGSKVTAPQNPTREGYTFKGWDKAVPSVMPAENVSIKALWEKNAEPDPKPDPEPTPEPDPEPNMPFVDVKEDDWFYDSVLWALERDITEGTSTTTFSPARGCTRGQMVTFLWRAAGEPKANNPVNPFEDVKEGAYYYDAVLWAVEQGITNGTSETTFEPDSVCTRGQSVTFLWRYYGKPQSSDVDNHFADVKKGAYYYDAVLWAVEHGITNGVKSDLFAPNHMCTRAQSAAFLYRAMK